jgi:hypothetical protein
MKKPQLRPIMFPLLLTVDTFQNLFHYFWGEEFCSYEREQLLSCCPLDKSDDFPCFESIEIRAAGVIAQLLGV